MLECSVVFRRQSAPEAAPATVERAIDEIFVVPVCSVLAPSKAAFLEFLRRSGALELAAEVVAGANLRRASAAEIARREVRAIFTAAEVDALAGN